jgi:hypothetical protein
MRHLSKTVSFVLAVSAVLGGCGGASTTAPVAGAATPVDAKGPVTLKFGWAPGARLSVVEDVAAAGQKFHSTYDIATEDAPEGLRVRFANVHATVNGGGAAAKDQDPTGFMAAMLMTIRSNFVVSRAGSVSTVEFDANRMQQDLEKAFPANMSADQKGMLLGMAGGFGRMAAESMARDDWQDLVETWAGRSLALGTPAAFERTQNVGALGDVHFDVSARLESVAPCPDGKGTCAKLVADAVAKPGTEPVKGMSLHMRRHLELVTDVTTLVPCSSLLQIESDVQGAGGPAESKESTRVERTYTRL